MLHDLDTALADLVASAVDVPGLVVRFSPYKDLLSEEIEAPTVHFLLHNVSENLDLRRGDWDVERDDTGRAGRRRPAIRLDCHYVVSVWVGGSGDRSAEEHRVAGAVLRGLLGHRRLPAELLHGELAGQEPPVRLRMANHGFLDQEFRFWSAMGGGPKLAFDYTVTISVEVDAAEDLGPVATEHVVALEPSSP